MAQSDSLKTYKTHFCFKSLHKVEIITYKQGTEKSRVPIILWKEKSGHIISPGDTT